MVRLTLIARVADGLPLAEGLENDKDSRDLEYYKQQAKTLFKKMSQGAAPVSRMSYESGAYVFHYIIEHGVCYLTLCDRSYPKRLAYQYLGELQKEFETQNLSQIETVSRPYAFIKFDTFIQKTKKLYLDTRTQRNLNKLSDDLAEVQQIVTKNIQDVLGMGDKLDQVTRMSNTLSSESKVYAGKARDLSRQALFKKWSPVIVVLLIVSLLFYFRSSWN